MGTRASIVVPARNESRRLEAAADRLLPTVDWSQTELVVVDDGSSDGTVQTARAAFGHLPHFRLLTGAPALGKGAAVRRGVLSCASELIAFVDADMATDPSALPRLFGALEHADVAIGSRALPDSTVRCGDVRRVVAGRAFNRIVRTVTGLPFRDTQCGFKAFRAAAARQIFEASVVDGLAFDVEVLSLACQLGFSVTEVAVDWTDISGGSVRITRDPVPMLRDLVRARHRAPAVDTRTSMAPPPLVVDGGVDVA